MDDRLSERPDTARSVLSGADETADIRFEQPLRSGTLIRRYKRFLAEVQTTDGERITAHCPNSGSMLSVSTPGAPVWLSESDNPKRKYPHTWEIVSCEGVSVGINTGLPNTIVARAIARGAIPELAGYARLRREVRYGAHSRIDMMLEDDGRPSCLIEVKNVTMRRSMKEGAPCEFPDAVTVRGTRHLLDLMHAVGVGMRAVIFFLVQRVDGVRMTIADDIDPVYDKTLRTAVSRGVEILSYRCEVSETGIQLAGRSEFLSPDAAVT
jgi:sugar fermentation stimulation protein A